MKSFDAPSVREILDKDVEKYGDKAFIKFKRNGIREERSYNKVCADSLAVCRWIRSMSQTGMHIAIVSKTNYEYLTCLTGILISGSIAVPFAPDISLNEATELFKRADIDIVLYDDDFAENAKSIQKYCPLIKHTINLGDENAFENIYKTYSADSEFAELSDFEVDKDACAMIIFTSGTTGIRKGVMLSTRALVSNNIYGGLEYSDDYCSLSVLPMHHVFCFVGDYLKNLMEGITICLNGNIRSLGENLVEYEPTVMRVVPLIAKSMLQKARSMMIKHPELSPKEVSHLVFGKKMKWMYSGGAYLNPEIALAYDELGFFLRQGYGMTELGSKVSIPYVGQSPDSVGKVMDSCDVRIQDGEIQVKSPSVMLGYYKMPEETAKMYTEDGWFKTGDLGYLDEDNQLFLTGRVKNIIVLSNGENVSPEALEKKFERDSVVSEAIVSAEDDRLVVEVFPNFDYAKASGIEDINVYLNELLKRLNESAKASHIISQLRVREKPFEKTTTGKTKRNINNI